MGGLMYMFIRKYTKVRSVADAARRAKSGVGQILRESHGFRSYYVLDGGDGVGVAVMIFEDRESANAANDNRLTATRQPTPLEPQPLRSPWLGFFLLHDNKAERPEGNVDNNSPRQIGT